MSGQSRMFSVLVAMAARLERDGATIRAARDGSQQRMLHLAVDGTAHAMDCMRALIECGVEDDQWQLAVDHADASIGELRALCGTPDGAEHALRWTVRWYLEERERER